MAIDTVETSLEISFEKLVSKFSDKINHKSFYELSSTRSPRLQRSILITLAARRCERVVVRHLHQLVQLPSPNTHVPAIEQRQYEGVGEQATKRKRAIVAVDPNDSHKVRHNAHRCLRSEHLRMQGQFQRAGCLCVE